MRLGRLLTGRPGHTPDRGADHERSRCAVSEGSDGREVGAGIGDVPGSRNCEPLQASGQHGERDEG